MEPSQILEPFQRFHHRFERGAVEWAVANREQAIPELLRILEDTVDRAAELNAEGDYMAHLYAMFLLAQFREVRAYPLVVRFAKLPGDVLDDLCEDFVTEYLGRVLASVCGGELDGIQSLIEDESANEWARGAGLDALLTLAATGLKSRDEVVNYLASLFRGKLARVQSYIWSSLVSVTTDLYPGDLLADIEQAYQDRLVDPDMITLRDVKRDLAAGKEVALARLVDQSDYALVENIEAEMGWWACFGEERPKRPAPEINPILKPLLPVKRPMPKVGRNDPCPCGSGKKYKKCCGA